MQRCLASLQALKPTIAHEAASEEPPVSLQAEGAPLGKPCLPVSYYSSLQSLKIPVNSVKNLHMPSVNVCSGQCRNHSYNTADVGRTIVRGSKHSSLWYRALEGQLASCRRDSPLVIITFRNRVSRKAPADNIKDSALYVMVHCGLQSPLTVCTQHVGGVAHLAKLSFAAVHEGLSQAQDPAR